MLQERRSKIISKLKQNNIVKVSELMDDFGVSIETIRRDLEYLEKHDYLKRVYGGAVLHGLNTEEPAYARREITHYEEKKAIATRTAAFINDGDTIFVDVGTTTLEVMRALKSKNNLTVITNSTLSAQAATENTSNRVILLGGELRHGDLSVSGYLCDNCLENFYANKALIGAGGIALENGITDYHLAEANTRRIMIEHSEKVIVVADASKFGIVAMNRVCPLDRIDILVTDSSLGKADVENYRSLGLTVIIAE